jgi:DNA modification methylase
MRLTNISEISIGPRQRKERPAGHLPALKASILSKGLLHAIVITQSGELLAGECRLKVIREIHEDGLTFLFDGKPVEHGTIPTSYISELSADLIKEAELEENLIRANLSWLEENEARAAIHKLKKGENPDQPIIATAEHILKHQGIEPTPKMKNTERVRIQQALLIDQHKDNPRVKAAKSTSDAVNIILEATERKLKRNLVESGVISSKHQVIKGDMFVVLPGLPAASYDTILVDPPYGIDVDKMKRSEAHHYDDSPENANRIVRFLIRDGWRLLKPKGHLIIFCDMEHFLTFRELAEMQAYTCWRTPLIWQKGQTGHAPHGRLGFIHTYECLLWCTKGQKGLAEPGGPDIFNFPRVARGDKVHAAEKPVDLLKFLLRKASLPGEKILDPCAGSGSILDAASALKMDVTAVEIDDAYHAEAVARLAKDVAIEDFRNPLERFQEDILKLPTAI